MGDYTKLSRFMGFWPEMSIFRRYGSLNAQNILLLQAEIAHLELELDVIREDEAQIGGGVEKASGPQCWHVFTREVASGEASEQYKNIMKLMREKLNEYSKHPPLGTVGHHAAAHVSDGLALSNPLLDTAVLQYSELCKLRSPTKHDLRSLRHWLSSKEGGDCFLQGVEAHAWDGERLDAEKDLVATADMHRQRDIFSAWLADNVMTWLQAHFEYWTKVCVQEY